MDNFSSTIKRASNKRVVFNDKDDAITFIENNPTFDGIIVLNFNDASDMFYDCTSLETIPKLDTSKVIYMDKMFYGCTSLKTIPQLDTSKVTDMRFMFEGCKSLRLIPQLNTSNVSSMRLMFDGCKSLRTIPNLDTSKVTDMYGMFEGCKLLKTIPKLNTSNVVTMYGMFYGCNSLEIIPQLNVSKVTVMNSMFCGCTSLKTIPQLDTSKVTDMSNMFCGCTSLKTIPKLNTSNVTVMNFMFHECTSLETIPQLNTSNVFNMHGMFDGCTSLKTIPNLDTSNVVDMSCMFANCKSLKNIPQLDTSKVTDRTDMFYGCQVGIRNMKGNFSKELDMDNFGLMNKNKIDKLLVNLNPSSYIYESLMEYPTRTPTDRHILSAAELINKYKSKFSKCSLDSQFNIALEICEALYERDYKGLFPDTLLDVWKLFNVFPDKGEWINELESRRGKKFSKFDLSLINTSFKELNKKKKNFSIKLDELKNSVGINEPTVEKEDKLVETEDGNFSSDKDKYVIINPKTGDKMCTPMSKEDCKKSLSGYPKGYIIVKANFTEEKIDVKDEATAREYGEALAHDVFGDDFDQNIFDSVFKNGRDKFGDDWNALAAYLKNCYSGSKKFSNEGSEIMKNFSKRLAALEESVGMNFSYIAFLYDDGNSLTTAMCKYNSGDMKDCALKLINRGLDGDDLAKPSDIKKIQKFDKFEDAEKWMDDVGRQYESKPYHHFSDVITTNAETTSPQPETSSEAADITDTEHGDSVPAPVEPMNLSLKFKKSRAHKDLTDKYKIDDDKLDSIFSEIYKLSNGNFHPFLFHVYLCRLLDKGTKLDAAIEELKDVAKELSTVNFSKTDDIAKKIGNNKSGAEKYLKIYEDNNNWDKNNPGEMTESGSKKISSALKSLGEPEDDEWDLAQVASACKKILKSAKKFSDTVTCPDCGRTISLDFTNLLTDEEFSEIAENAKEFTKYPEQYGNATDQVQAFSDWLQNSRFNEFCKEALFKAFCK